MKINNYILACLILSIPATIHVFDAQKNTTYQLVPVSYTPGIPITFTPDNKLLDCNEHGCILQDNISTSMYANGDYKFSTLKNFIFFNFPHKAKLSFSHYEEFMYGMNQQYFIYVIYGVPGLKLIVFDAVTKKHNEHVLNLKNKINKIKCSTHENKYVYLAHGEGGAILNLEEKDFSIQQIRCQEEVTDIIELSKPNELLLLNQYRCSISYVDHLQNVTNLETRTRTACANKLGTVIALANSDYQNVINLYSTDDLRNPIKKLLLSNDNVMIETYHMAFVNNDTQLVCVTNIDGNKIHLFDLATEQKVFFGQTEEKCITKMIVPNQAHYPYIAMFMPLLSGWIGLKHTISDKKNNNNSNEND